MGRWKGYLSAVAFLTLATAASGQGRPADSAGPLHVLELYTSQGCSSCPAADALLKVLAARPDTMALSFSVDYWDHLGWKDTLALPKNAQRQRDYAKALGTGNVYTPQVVVNGIAQSVGSNKAGIEKAMYSTAAARKRDIALSASSNGNRVVIDIGGDSAGAAQSGTVWLVIVSPSVDVKVKHGENRGRALNYANVVREMTAVGMWSGKAMKLELPASAVMSPGLTCAVLLQGGVGGPILGATWMTP
jgi:hypothetical protein